MLKQLTVQWYKGFCAKQTFRFAIPDGTHAGSGLTIIVGPNNSGKTTFIESLAFTIDSNNSHHFSEGARHARPPVISITTDTGKTRRITNVDGGSQVKLLGDNVDDQQIEIVSSRRHWEAQYSGDMDFTSFSHQSSRLVRNAGDPGTAALLARVNRDPAQKAQLTNLMKKLVPDFTTWTVDTRDQGGDYIRYETGRGRFHAVDMLGDGIISLFRICLHLVNVDTDALTLVIDEPELSLHPSAQKMLRQVLSSASAKKQIIIITHSPLLVDWNDISNGACVIRLNKVNDMQCVVSQLNPAGTYMSRLTRAVKQYQKPELLDSVAKEILFANRVLFLEGKEDVGLLRRWLHSSGKAIEFEMFGYGVGGHGDMHVYLSLAKDLGISRVGALFDGSTSSYATCKSDFPEYKVEELSVDDIRDKFEDVGGVKTQLHTGLFDASGELKPASLTELEGLIDDFNAYFSS